MCRPGCKHLNHLVEATACGFGELGTIPKHLADGSPKDRAELDTTHADWTRHDETGHAKTKQTTSTHEQQSPAAN